MKRIIFHVDVNSAFFVVEGLLPDSSSRQHSFYLDASKPIRSRFDHLRRGGFQKNT